MKKVMFLFVSFFATTTLSAQTVDKMDISTTEQVPKAMQKGKFLVGLNGTGGFGGGPNHTNNSWSATGQGGYFISNRLLVGLQLSYGESNRQFEQYNIIDPSRPTSTEYHFKFYSPEVFARYYFTDWKVKPFAQLSTGWNFSLGNLKEFSGLSTRVSDNNFTAKAALGVSFKIGKRANIDLLYSQSLIKSRNFGDGNGLRLGATFLLGK